MLEGRPISFVKWVGGFLPNTKPKSDIYCLLLAFESERRNFSIQECKKIGVHAGRCQEAELVAQELCNLVGTSYRLELPNYENLAKLYFNPSLIKLPIWLVMLAIF